MAAKILVVDDEVHIREVLSIKLRNAGYETYTAEDGEVAFEIARRHVPGLIITDFQMPYMTGLDLCAALAADPATAVIPVVLLTARGYALDDDDMKTGNIRKVLSKPFSPRSVLQLAAALLASADGAIAEAETG